MNDEYVPDPAVNFLPAGEAELVTTLADGTKVKRRMLRMRACTERDAKGKMCRGHLKRYFDPGEELQQLYGKKPELYRCERCKTIYLPNEAEQPRTGTMAW